MKMNHKVDAYVREADRWQDELEKLRTIILDCELTEDWKWRQPCYTYQESNVIIISELKESCTISFFKGALLKDADGVLEKPGPNSRAARVIRFTTVDEIAEMEPVLKAYINEAIKVEKAGLEVDFEENRIPEIPEELQAKFDEVPALKTAFDELTPGRQRGYILYFSRAKQSKTRERRIEKYMQRILDGKGLHDR